MYLGPQRAACRSVSAAAKNSARALLKYRSAEKALNSAQVAFRYEAEKYAAKQIPSYQQANQQMESLSKQWQSQIEAKANEAKKLYEDYQKSANTLSATQKTSKEEAIVAKEKEAAELRKQYFGPEGELMKKRQELISPIQDAIYNAVKEIATQRGYDAVIDRASAQSMIFASPRIDISNEVLAKLGYSN